MIILIKASIILCCLWAFYKLVLERESFFAANRIYLFSCVFLAVLIPFISIPQLSEHQGIVEEIIEKPFKKEAKASEIKSSDLALNKEVVNPSFTKDILIENKTEVSRTATDIEQSNPYLEPSESHVSESTSISLSLSDWLFYIYLFGVVILGINFIGQILSVVRKVWSHSDKIASDDGIIVNLEKDTEPCSFFNYIFINPTKYDYNTYEQILDHERIHVSKWHSIDLIFSELSVIFMWFNPFVWLLRKEVEKNIEFQTDDLLISDNNAEKESYQLNLVKIACNTHPLAVTTNYNQSLIKKRILKMNSKRSNTFSYWKYSFVLPILFILLIILNKPTSLLALESFPMSEIPNAIIEKDSSVLSQLEPKPNEADSAPKDKYENIIENDVPQISKTSKIDDESIIPKTTPIPSIQNEIILTEKELADCEEFEKAVQAGDLDQVKRILKTLHPDCLKLKKKKKSNASSLRKMIKEKKEDIKNKTPEMHSDVSACLEIRKSVDERDYQKLKHLLTYADISCLNNIYGEPAEDIPLLQEILKNNGGITIGRDNVITISANGYLIDISEHSGPNCNDPNFLRLVDAIKHKNEAEIRNILSNEDLSCPLDSETKENDFPFIKLMMPYGPEIHFTGNTGITISGLGVLIDLDKKVDIPSFLDAEDFIEKNSLEEIESLLNEGNEKALENATCLDLMEAIELGEIFLVESMIKELNLNCYHRKTHTYTDHRGESTTSFVFTPLIVAISQGNNELVRMLLNNNADVHYTGDGLKTPLMRAAQFGYKDIAKTLLEFGARLQDKDKFGKTAIDYATANDQDDMIRFLSAKNTNSTSK